MTTGSPGAATGAVTTAERKLLTLMFVDLSGYTRLTTTRDPEDVQHTVAPVLTELRVLAEQHGGYIPSVQGDGFLAVFGAPTSHADDPLRAVASAVAMRGAIDDRRAAGADVPDVHVGIASGEVLVTTRADAQDVVGAAVNLAARLSDAAVAGEVLVDEATMALTSDDAIFGAPRALDLAGFVGPVRAVALFGLGSRSSDVGLLVGRAEERAALDQAWDEVVSTGSSAAVVVTGEAGLGKTQLVESWAASRPGVVVMRGGCRPYGSPLPLSALSEAITAATELPTGQDVQSEFVQLLPRQRGTTVGREPDAALAVTARRLLQAVSATTPTVLLLEDLHWADAALGEVVRSLHSEPLAGALLVVATAREAVNPLPSIPLAPLGTEDIAAVVEERIGAAPAPALLQLLAERSAGNPLWLVECLGLLSDRGQLAVDGSVVSVRESDGEVEIPSSIRLLVAARLDRLTPEQKRALQQTSVWPGAVPSSAWPGRPEDLTTLQALGLLQQDDGELLRFSHGLVREAVYRSMPRADRVSEHEKVLTTSTDLAARAYSASEVHRLDVAPDLARRQAIGDRALRTAVEHARHLRLSHTRAAADVLLRAMPLIDELDALVPAACAVLLTELAELLRDLEDVARSREHAARAVSLAELACDTGATTAAKLALGQALLGSDNALAREIAEGLLDLPAADHVTLARAWRLLGGAHVYGDSGQTLRCLEHAYECAAAAGDVDSAAGTARLLAWNLSVTADEAFERWLAVADARTPADHLLGQGELALIRAVVAQARGEWEESWQKAQLAVSLMERVGMHRFLVDALALSVEGATATGRRSALPGLLNRLTAASDGHRARLQVTALCASAPALVLLVRDNEAQRALARAEALLPSVGPNEAMMLWSARGHVAALSDSHDEAARAYGHAETLALQHGLTLYAHGCRLQRLLAAGRAGHPVAADEAVELVAHLEGARATPLAQQARTLAHR